MIKEKRITGRRVAMTYVYQAILLDNIDEVTAHLSLDEGFLSLDQNTQAFINNLIEHTLANQPALAKKINPLLKKGWRIDRLNKVEQAILYLASYELLYTDTQKKVVIDEYINLTKRFCDAGSYKFINAVIDQIHKDE